jgi:hypothetical protein
MDSKLRTRLTGKMPVLRGIGHKPVGEANAYASMSNVLTNVASAIESEERNSSQKGNPLAAIPPSRET